MKNILILLILFHFGVSDAIRCGSQKTLAWCIKCCDNVCCPLSTIARTEETNALLTDKTLAQKHVIFIQDFYEQYRKFKIFINSLVVVIIMVTFIVVIKATLHWFERRKQRRVNHIVYDKI